MADISEPKQPQDEKRPTHNQGSQQLTPSQRIYLEIPHYSQLDTLEHNINPAEARSVCAIMCIKSVIDYELGDSSPATSYSALKSEVETFGGKHPQGGWFHYAMVDVIKSHGLVCWRRNWRAPNQDTTFFATNEGYNRSQMAAVDGQIRNESLVLTDPKLQAQASIIDSLRSGHPVIVSVGPGFSENAENHLVVVHGYASEAGQEAFYVTDPLQRDGEHQLQKVSLNFFLDKFNERAIFVARPQSAVA